jgi:hypothetical protein
VPPRSPQLNCHSALVLALYEFAQGTVDQLASRPHTGQLARAHEQPIVENCVGTLHTPIAYLSYTARKHAISPQVRRTPSRNTDLTLELIRTAKDA